jgi:glucose/arabinose dehydrogenase
MRTALRRHRTAGALTLFTVAVLVGDHHVMRAGAQANAAPAQGGRGQTGAPAGRGAGTPSGGRGAGAAQGRGGRGGRGGGGVPAQPAWATDPLPAGPLPLETALYRDLRVVVVARGLDNPWALAFLPNGDALLTERPGRIRIIRNGVLDPVPVAGGPNPVRTSGLQGLMDIVLHPQFATNKYVYISYHRPVAIPGANAAPGTPVPTTPNQGATTLARGVWDGTSIRNLTDIFQTTATGTESSRIAFGRDGKLYMTVSANGDEKLTDAQNPGTYAGKVVRLNEDGTIPTDNPFSGKAGYLPAIFTMGHRNGHSLQVNPETGELWATEQGPDGGDEINIIRAGKNYGWPVVSYGRAYAGPKISENQSRPEFEDPHLYWVPAIAVTGMTFYTGDRFPKWKRNVFVTGLRQGESPRTGQLQRIEFNDKWEELRREPLLRDLGQRMRDVVQGPDGCLYVLTAESNNGPTEGAVLRIEPRDGPAGSAR